VTHRFGKDLKNKGNSEEVVLVYIKVFLIGFLLLHYDWHQASSLIYGSGKDLKII
jgi:hypothetical protein